MAEGGDGDTEWRDKWIQIGVLKAGNVKNKTQF